LVGKEGLINEFDEDLIENFNKLLKKVESWRCMGENIALCHGCFDPLHVGHVAHFRAASQLADRLIVTLTPDIYINKSAGRPFIKQRQRLYNGFGT
jgi:cytidyltransferase-like protein